MTARGGRWSVSGVGLVALLAAAALAAHRSRPARLSSPAAEGRAAYDRGDWPAAEAAARRRLASEPGDAGAAALLARSLARRGLDGQAEVVYAGLAGAAGLGAEDLFLLGRCLARGGRPVLAAAALDAAAKLGGDRGETALPLADLRARAGDSAGDPAALASAADHLAAVPGGGGLATLVLGLLKADRRGSGSMPTGPGGVGPLLDRVLACDRATLAGVDGPAAARRLLARVLLQDGRPAEALGLLAPGDGPEADWLLSRAELGLGHAALASEAVDRAGDYGADRPAAPEPSPYAGAKSCAGCHGAIYRAEQNSRHSATLAAGPGLAAVPLPDGPVDDPGGVTGVTHHFRRDGASVRVETDVEGGETRRAVVDYALGSGHHGQTLLAKDEQGNHRFLRVSYYHAGDHAHWGLTDGFEPGPTPPDLLLGQTIGEGRFRECVHCHATRFRPGPTAAGPEAADRGIGCERCHGPGGNHLLAIESGFPQPAIARPKRATPADRRAICAQCHSADGTIPPENPRYIRFQSTTLPFSRCLTEGGGRLDCVACHDPHRDAETRPAYYEARCLACHGGGAAGNGPAPEFGPIRLEPVAAGRCPVNPRSDCLGCHMPKVKDVVPFTTFTDHHIRVHRDAPAAVASESARP